MADQVTKKPVDAKKIEKRANKKAAMLVIKEFIDASKNEKVIAALKTVKPSFYGGAVRTAKVGGTSPMATFLKTVREAGKAGVAEDVIFKTLKAGRKECNQFIKNGLKRSEPADRLWISFNAEKGLYTMVGTGTNPPANWEGYIPVDTKVELK